LHDALPLSPLVGPFWYRRVGPSPALVVKVHTHRTLDAAHPDPVPLAVQLHREIRTLHRSVEYGKHNGLQGVPRLRFRRLLVRKEIQLLHHVPSPFVVMKASSHRISVVQGPPSLSVTLPSSESSQMTRTRSGSMASAAFRSTTS